MPNFAIVEGKHVNLSANIKRGVTPDSNLYQILAFSHAGLIRQTDRLWVKFASPSVKNAILPKFATVIDFKVAATSVHI